MINFTTSRIFLFGLFTILFLSAGSFQSTLAVGAYPFPQEKVQPDGSTITIRLHGDEWYNWMTTIDGYRLLKSRAGYFEYAARLKSGQVVTSGIRASNPDQRPLEEQKFLSSVPKNIGVSKKEIRDKRTKIYSPRLKSSLMSTHFPSEGEAKLLVILANFSDTPASYSPADFDAFMNEPSYNGTGSFKDYYQEVSSDMLTVNSTVTRWVEVPYSHDYYGPEKKWGEFALHAIEAAAEAGVDFSQFDNTGDGIVEGVAIIHQGAGQEVSADSSDIWSHSYSLAAWGLPESERTFNGVVVNQYTAQPEWRTTAGDMNTIGVICHEFGHNLGLLDFYDTNEDEDGQFIGTGVWDIMASGTYNGNPVGSSPAHHNPFSKADLGWINITEINEASSLKLSPVSDSLTVFKINSPNDNEYLLLENRQRQGFDYHLPHGGMIIYHADSDVIEEKRTSNSINTTEHQGFYPIAAGGIINDGSCPFPGTGNMTQFTDSTSPAMETWDGQPFNRSMTSIAMENQIISFDFMHIQDGSPLAFNASVADEQSIELSWTLSSNDYPVLLAWSPDGSFGTPKDNYYYSAGEQIEGGGTVLYYGNSLTSIIHEGLQPTTKYFYSVWSDKGDIYSQNLKDEGQTRPLPISTFPWEDNFGDGLGGWYQDYLSGDFSWTNDTLYIGETKVVPYSGNSYASLFAQSFEANVTRLVAPRFDLQNDKTYYLKFRHIQAEWEGDQDELSVLVRSESTDKWEQIAHFDQHTPEWAERRIKIPYSEPIEMAFQGTTNYGHGIGIDEVEISEAKSCQTSPDVGVSSISTSNISKTAIDVSWKRGNGDRVLVLAREGKPIFELPDLGTSYTADSEYGKGDSIANGTYVVYDGTGTNLSLEGLRHTSDYHLAFFEYFQLDFCYENQPTSKITKTEPELYDITISVSDIGGALIENAMVKFMEDTLFTNSSGEIVFQTMHGNLFNRVDVSKEEHNAKTERFIPDGPKTIDVVLHPVEPLGTSNLSGIKDYKTINLEWEPVINDNFDNYRTYSTEIPGWTFLDKDQAPTWGVKQMTWPNETKPMAYMVFGPYEEQVIQMEYNISSWSGDKVLAAFAAREVPSNDWIVSPEFLVKESDFFSFMARTLDEGYWGKEVINVKIRAKGDSDWTTLYQNIEVPEVWTRYEYDLAQYVGQHVEVAVQSVGHETFILLLDDFRVGTELGPIAGNPVPQVTSANIDRTKRSTISNRIKPKQRPKLTEGETPPSLYAGNIEYGIFRDGNEIARTHGFANNSYKDLAPGCQEYAYTVKAFYPVVGMKSESTAPVAIEACYSVLFTVKNETGDLIEGAKITFNNEMIITDSDGEALFTGVMQADDRNYSVEAKEYSELEDSVDINQNTSIDVTLSPTDISINETWIDRVSFSPNPVVSAGTLDNLPHGIFQIEIFDITGQRIDARGVQGGQPLSWDFSVYSPGIYMMLIKATDGQAQRLKIINLKN